MIIRQASYADLADIMGIYAEARQYMRESGNPNQWGENYPPTSVVEEDISLGRCHLCMDEGEIAGVFCFFKGTDPTYATIYEGAWLSDAPYGVMHRVAVAKRGRGVVKCCFDYALERCGNLRIDTHRDNVPMQSALAKNGFAYCGIIYLANGAERLAYQKIINGEGK